MSKKKEPLTIPEIVEEFQKYDLENQIEILNQVKQIVSDQVQQAEDNIKACKSITNGKQ